MNKDDFDDSFDKAFSEAAKNHEFVPDSSQSWEKLQKKINRRAKRRTRRTLIPYVAASFLLGAVIFGTPTATIAFTPFYHAIKSIQEDFVRVIFGSNDHGGEPTPRTSPPPGDQSNNDGHDLPAGESSQQNFKSWEDASKVVSFPRTKISYTPSGYELNNVLAIFNEGQEKAASAVLFYKNSEDQGLTITLRQLEPNEKLSSTGRGSDITFEAVQADGIDAYLFLAKDGTASIEYMIGGKYVSVVGTLSKEEIIKVAENIK